MIVNEIGVAAVASAMRQPLPLPPKTAAAQTALSLALDRLGGLNKQLADLNDRLMRMRNDVLGPVPEAQQKVNPGLPHGKQNELLDLIEALTFRAECAHNLMSDLETFA
jgi:hypothetical protein